MFNGPDVEVNVLVFSAGCPEINRMLRNNAADREAKPTKAVFYAASIGSESPVIQAQCRKAAAIRL
jgi:hypothetical protein